LQTPNFAYHPPLNDLRSLQTGQLRLLSTLQKQNLTEQLLLGVLR
jgi:hypothetical protein